MPDTAPVTIEQPTAPGLTFKNQTKALEYLLSLGYKIGKTKFNDDITKHKRLGTNPDGHFEAWALKEYAQRMQLPQLASGLDAKGSQAATQKITADTRLKDVQAARQELKLQKEQGLIMLKSEHEAGLSARALFFKNEIENFIRLRAASIIQLVGGSEEAEPLLIEWWDEATADWMDSWSKDREFMVDDDDTRTQADETGEEIAEDMETEE